MSIQLLINNSNDPLADYIGWAPTPCSIKSTDQLAGTVILRNLNPDQGGQVVFMLRASGPVQDEISLDLPLDGSPVNFFIAGKFDAVARVGFASTADKDTIIAVIDAVSLEQIAQKELMVRVRKNANSPSFTAAERDRFLSALVRINQQGKFVDFQNMHISATSPEIHGRECFLPWHRALLLDIERNLQAVDPSVSLPYWKFDEAAPNVFSRDFMGVPDSTGLVDFTNTNPLISWRVQIFGEGNGRIRRIPAFNTAQRSPRIQNDEDATFALGQSFSRFMRMEDDPHGSAHVSFNGQISNIGRAPADPLFFMLHANVDRLWAKWQWITTGQRFRPTNTRSYSRQGQGNVTMGGTNGIGNFTLDTMWPWNGIFGSPRPASAPGGMFPLTTIAAEPGQKPMVKAMIDYQGQVNLGANLGFAYDDVPYTFRNIVV